MVGETRFGLKVTNLPNGTSWQQIKDLVKHGDNESIKVNRADVVEGTQIGWLWFLEYADLQLAYEFLKRKKHWKGSRLKVEKWISGQAPLPNDGRLQNPFVYQINAGIPAIRYPPPPFLTNQFSETEPRDMPVSYISPSPRSYFFMMSSPYMVPTSEYGSSGSASSSGAASTSDSTTSDSPPHTPVYLTEPRGVHIRNVPFETSESAIRRFVARTLQIRDDQILDTLYPTHYSTTSHNMSHSYPQHQSHLVETDIPQYVNSASDYSVTTMKFGDGDHGDHGDHIGQLAGANLEPEFIDPLVVDGSKNRDLPKLPSNGERSTKGKSKKDLGGDSKGKQKHKRH